MRMEGPLSKWTNVMKGWQFRWFVLDDNAGILSYYTSKEKMVRGARRGCVRLKAAVVGIDDDDDSTFTITVDGKTFHFQSHDAEERETWIRALEETILRHSAVQKKWSPNRSLPSIADFESKVTESDAYLQLLIDLSNKLEDQHRLNGDANCTAQYELVASNFNKVIESVKKCIVLLQIAKNTAFPINGVPKLNSLNLEPSPCTSEDFERFKFRESLTSEGVAPPLTDVQSGIEMGQEVDEVSLSVRNSMQSSEGNIVFASLPAHVPETSYSSSEDEDFFDADDFADGESSLSSPKSYFDAFENFRNHSLSHKDESSTSPSVCRSSSLVRLSDPSLDWDSMYEEEDDDSLYLEGHGSIIQHLISQVKIGMDLTKVTLPTFILERRSLLEMYADFFAHPDLFCSISSFDDPKDRMVQVLKWYLSAFHAGRKSEVAKKPYNPILGETFRCYWESPSENPQSETSEGTSEDGGPVPWANHDQLAFVAEQVSHHPPVSAFYAEHVNKKISFCGHIWTKSKFLGLSVCVNNIGQGCVSLLDLDEEYILNFPSGYGRSILTVPWIELGGTCQITCSKTGFNANVEFLTKPFYGGKKHRILAEVFSPGEKKPFLNVEGEWNGKMEAKWNDGRTEVFVDTQRIPIVKKNVQPVLDQQSNESRFLWREVTAGLKFNNIHEATRNKLNLEQKQRKEAKERKEAKKEWDVKLFSLEGENWVYKKPLQLRKV